MAVTRVIVISDLHLGGTPPTMMSHPERLAEFIRHLPQILTSDELLELVIAGDFVDFLAIPSYAKWTPEPSVACKKLEQTMSESPFAQVFDALRDLVAAHHRLTIMVGNHDVEMALPQVQHAFLQRVGASSHQVLFVDDGCARRIGKALIEHGNRYDDANRNDWAGLRAMVSALSRCEQPGDELQVSAGSEIVEQVVCPLKKTYPFIDLLQPQGELLAYLLYAFEPALIRQVDKIAWVLRGQGLQNRNPKGLKPGQSRYVANTAGDDRDPELEQVFSDMYPKLHNPHHEVGVREWLPLLSSREGLAAIFERGEHVPERRLTQIRVAITRLLLNDQSAQLDGPTQQYGEAAKRLIRDSASAIEVVVMGHTHLARHIGEPIRASYINTGTWADIVRVPDIALSDPTGATLEKFLRDLKNNAGRRFYPTYADLRVEAEGQVSCAKLIHVGD